jgi:hypothetical protein
MNVDHAESEHVIDEDRDVSVTLKQAADAEVRSAVTEASDSWMQMYGLLKDYCDDHGHSNVPYKYRATLPSGKNVRLGAWLAAQRQSRRIGLLSDERCRHLQQLSDEGKFKWNYQSEVSDSKWEKAFTILLQYGDINGHCNVPKKYSVHLDDGSVLNLGNWLNDQRKSHTKNLLPAGNCLFTFTFRDHCLSLMYKQHPYRA